jgi:serine/threonine-protein kinase
MDHLTQPTSQPTPPAGAGNGGPDLTGRTLGEFHVLRRLGEGGMGQVYLAEQVSLKRKVALKILRADLAANPTALQRFQQEAEAVARATHANIVQVYAIGACDGLHYMALEYVEGRNLRDYLARKGPPDVPLALSVMRQVAAALQRAGELGIIHRDIKPENILLTRKGEVKVADFGLSRCLAPDGQPLHLTQSGVTMGTPLYMSPEQVEGRAVDLRTDIYSFGVTCYHMLAGHPPFQGETAFAVAMHHVQTEPTPLEAVRPDLPAHLCAVVMKMMAKDPARRYQTAGELLLDLGRLRESLTGAAPAFSLGLSIEAPAVTPPTQPTLPGPEPVQRTRWLPWAMAGSMLLALAGGAALAWWQHASRNFLPPPGPPAAAEKDPDKIFSAQNREQRLLAEVEEHLYFKTEPVDKMRQALGAYLDLGLFYLEQWRLDDAERLFGRVGDPRHPPPYVFLGRLGQAMVLAFRDKPDESNRLFKELLVEKKPDAKKPAGQTEFVLLQRLNSQLRPMVARALDHNAANSPATFPRELESLRKPPPRLRPEKPLPKGEE